MNDYSDVPVSTISLDDMRAAGWWTSADGQGQLDMRGVNVGSAVAELLSVGDDDDRAEIIAGTIGVGE